jgi:hypothetical protein
VELSPTPFTREGKGESHTRGDGRDGWESITVSASDRQPRRLSRQQLSGNCSEGVLHLVVGKSIQANDGHAKGNP